MLKKFLILILLSLSNCGFTVVYKDVDSTKEGKKSYYAEEFAAIRIKKNRTKIDQELKNNLYDLLNPELIKAEPKYLLILDTKKNDTSTFTTATGSSGRNKVYLNVTYYLKDLKTAETIATGNTSVNDNYDVTENRFATYTTDEYVKSNLTKVAAQNIRNSLINDFTDLKRKSENTQNQ